jgi:hypothetical protein
MKRASYREGVLWIALNDEPEAMELEEVERIITVMFLADLFGVEVERVARDVIRKRQRSEW